MANDLRDTLRRGLDERVGDDTWLIPSPWPSFDALLEGLWPGLYGLSGPSGVGRTQLLLQWLLHAALENIPSIGYLSLTDPREITLRLVCLLKDRWWSQWAKEPDAVTAIVASHPLSALPVDVIGLVVPTEKDLEARLHKARQAKPNDPLLVVIDPDDAVTTTIPWVSLHRMSLRTRATIIVASSPSTPPSVLNGHMELIETAHSGRVLRLKKHRYGRVGEIDLTFERGRFESPPTEIELELKDL
ncbi:MAG: hypothetical protein AAF449_15150 [Myxococcota bacterium]